MENNSEKYIVHYVNFFFQYLNNRNKDSGIVYDTQGEALVECEILNDKLWNDYLNGIILHLELISGKYQVWPLSKYNEEISGKYFPVIIEGWNDNEN